MSAKGNEIQSPGAKSSDLAAGEGLPFESWGRTQTLRYEMPQVSPRIIFLWQNHRKCGILMW